MAQIRPFRAYRPCQGMEKRIAALPYDVYNREEACEVVKKNPDSFLAVDRAETQFGEEVDTYADCVYEKADQMLREKILEGKFVQDPTPCFYLYELTMDGNSQTGVVGCASIDDYRNNVIKKHENTRAEKELDRIRHVDICDAQTGPIFLAYRDNAAITGIVNKIKTQDVEYDFTSPDGIRHRVWVIGEAGDIAAIRKAFADIDQLYIADGHHRAASAVKVGEKRRNEHPGYTGEEEFNFFLSVLFPESELKILDYNRVVKDLNGMTEDAFLQKIKEIFEVSELIAKDKHPQEKGTFSMYLKERWYTCKVRPEDQSEDPVKGLDVSLLQNLMLTPVLGITDPKTDPRIDFVGGIRGTKELEKRCHEDAKAAFAMYPTSIGELFAVADAGLLMPPKSTWFEPKLRSGLFIHLLNE